jgi:hypothetical protein
MPSPVGGKPDYPLELGHWSLVDLAARPLFLATISLRFGAEAPMKSYLLHVLLPGLHMTQQRWVRHLLSIC